MSTMTKGERTDLARLIRRRAKLARDAAAQRAAEILADFERQLGTVYSYDDDEVWKAATEAADEAVENAKKVIAERCEELGIPPEFRPNVSFNWYGRGQNSLRERRSELRKMATTQIAAAEKAARTKIEHCAVEAETALVSEGLTSDVAKEFLTKMPAVETMMPVLDAGEIKGLLDSKAHGRG